MSIINNICLRLVLLIAADQAGCRAAPLAPANMADQQPPATASHFPNPPDFFHLYADPGSPGAPAPTSPEPPEGAITVFGREVHPIEPHTPPLLVTQLYQTSQNGIVDFKSELKRLSAELLFLFLELLQVLSEAPVEHPSLVTKINQVLQNMQHLNNKIRPFQARATLKHILMQDVERKESAIQEVRGQVQEAEGLLLSAAESLAQIDGNASDAEDHPKPMDLS